MMPSTPPPTRAAAMGSGFRSMMFSYAFQCLSDEMKEPSWGLSAPRPRRPCGPAREEDVTHRLPRVLVRLALYSRMALNRRLLTSRTVATERLWRRAYERIASLIRPRDIASGTDFRLIGYSCTW